MTKLKNIQDYLPSTRSLVWSAISICICIGLLTAAQYHKRSNIESVYINISETGESKSLVTKKMVAELVSKIVPRDMSQSQIAELNLRRIEETLANNSRISNAEVYINGNNDLIIDVFPREPALRIKNKNGEDYYVDREGNKIAIVENVAIRVPVVSGYLNEYDPKWKDLKSHDMHDIYKIANVLTEDEVLKALVEQVYFESNGDITFIPKIGRERIEIGTTENLDYKIENLKQSYKLIMKQKGWNSFKTLNLAYKNQVLIDKG